MIKKWIILSVVFEILLISGCKGQEEHSCTVEIHDSPLIRVLVDESSLGKEKSIGDSILIYFEYGFKNNYVRIKKKEKASGEFVFQDSIVTDASIGLAKKVNVGLVESMLAIQIDEYCMFSIESFPSNFVRVNFINDTLEVRFYNHLPYYD